MNKIKYISFSLIVLLIGILCISSISINKIYASELYEGGEFDASVTTDNSLLPDYAIVDIEKLVYNDNSVIRFKIDTSKFNSNYPIFYFSTKEFFSGSYSEFNVCFSSNNLGFKSIRCYSLDNTNFFNFYPSSDLEHVGLYLLSSSTRKHIYVEFYNLDIDYKGNFINSLKSYKSDNFNDLVDMKSDTNFNLPLFNFKYENGNFNFLGCIFNSIGNTAGSYYIDINSEVSSFGLKKSNSDYIDYTNSLNYIYRLRYDFVFNDSVVGYECEFSPTTFSMDIYKPSYRLNNSLIFYCFDYLPFLNNVNAFDCYYRRGSYLYKLMFYDNKIPNSYYSVYFNNELNNIIFDEYISLVFDLSTLDLNQLIIDNTGVYLSFGFDFNFVQYSQPLVASNGSFNYTFDKPKYVDMKFSLAPFYIPVLEMVENAFIFLMFYCPIISDVLELIHLDMFMGGIINVINFIVGGAVGQFVFSCIAFIIFFELLRRFMPVVYSAKNDIVEMYHNSNGYKYRQEKKQAKKEWKYQQYKDKQVAKQVNKLKKKMGKKK